jgi:hypothetical protein
MKKLNTHFVVRTKSLLNQVYIQQPKTCHASEGWHPASNNYGASG